MFIKRLYFLYYKYKIHILKMKFFDINKFFVIIKSKLRFAGWKWLYDLYVFVIFNISRMAHNFLSRKHVEQNKYWQFIIFHILPHVYPTPTVCMNVAYMALSGLLCLFVTDILRIKSTVCKCESRKIRYRHIVHRDTWN